MSIATIKILIVLPSRFGALALKIIQAEKKCY